MIDTLYGLIKARIVTLAIFRSVDTALTGEAAPLPAADIWLAEEKVVSDRPAIIRELTWVVRITVGHSDTKGAAQAQMHGHLDAVRNLFAGWVPPGYVGIKGMVSVPQIKIDSFVDHGSTVYLLSVVMQVFPEAFRAV